MEYVDGGTTYSGAKGWAAAITCAPITYICGQLAGAGKQALWKMATNGKFTITCTKNPTALFNVK